MSDHDKEEGDNLVVVRAIQDLGLRKLDQNFFDELERLYEKPSIDEVITEEVPLIRTRSPYFFERHLIDLGNIDERLKDLYPDDYDNVSYCFKVRLRQARYLLLEEPDKTEALNETVRGLKKILDGGNV
ncbi:MAG: hypothetical protein CMH64_04460 [Nanoarchaeota archaeon]|nr:hypothetical protein [Nanoarchaeota archaeon]|tara:strand:+ start:1039 stop:1425 length:387 start_codon:yes stop_codon:yes gene_type:complete